MPYYNLVVIFAALVGIVLVATAKVAPAKAPIASDDLKALVSLEAENQRLRKSLADKLRKENAELRKRLGLA